MQSIATSTHRRSVRTIHATPLSRVEKTCGGYMGSVTVTTVTHAPPEPPAPRGVHPSASVRDSKHQQTTAMSDKEQDPAEPQATKAEPKKAAKLADVPPTPEIASPEAERPPDVERPKPASTKSIPAWLGDLQGTLHKVERELMTVHYHKVIADCGSFSEQHMAVMEEVILAQRHVEDATNRLARAVVQAQGLTG